jgi:2-keto-4-pentenoate hydratase
VWLPGARRSSALTRVATVMTALRRIAQVAAAVGARSGSGGSSRSCSGGGSGGAGDVTAGGAVPASALLARALWAAWQDGAEKCDWSQLSKLSPEGLDNVYDVHDELCALASAQAERGGSAAGPGAVGGWKLGGAGAASEADGTKCEAVFAPLWSSRVVNGPGRLLSNREHGVWAVEAEIAFVMGRALIPGAARPTGPRGQLEFSPEQICDAVGSVRLAIEVVGSRYGAAAVRGVPSMLRLADTLSSGWAVLASEPALPLTRELRARLDGSGPPLSVALLVNGEERARGSTAEVPLGSPLAALRWMANRMARRGRTLEEGAVVISGKCCAVNSPGDFDRLVATFDGLGRCETGLVP